jgi:predicted acetyltransferase
VGLDIRPVTAEEHSRSVELFLTAILIGVRLGSDPDPARALTLDRTLGAFLDGEMVGTATSFAAGYALPGGAQVPSGAVTRVGVLPTHTRRGLLTAMMRAQLEDLAARGDVVAHLRASEAPIYGRFGYGLATQYTHTRIERRRGAFRQPAEAPGSFRLVADDELAEVLSAAYDRCWGRRPGTIERTAATWAMRLRMRTVEPPAGRWVVAHLDPSGRPDGFADYQTVDRMAWDEPGRGQVDVHELWGADDAVEGALWRWLLDLDLAPVIAGHGRPLDDPVRWRLVDPRALATTDVVDETWLRLLDVEAALGARTYGPGDPVVIEVSDPLFAANEGRWEASPDGFHRVDAPADLAVGVDVLGAVALGGTSWAELAAGGRVEVRRPAALVDADRLFAVRPLPWCGTFF